MQRLESASRRIPPEVLAARAVFTVHAADCPACRSGESYCPRGALLHAVAEPAGDPDLPGYGASTYPAI